MLKPILLPLKPTELTDTIVEDARSNVRMLKRLVFFQVLIRCNRLHSTNLIRLRSKLQILI